MVPLPCAVFEIQDTSKTEASATVAAVAARVRPQPSLGSSDGEHRRVWMANVSLESAGSATRRTKQRNSLETALAECRADSQRLISENAALLLRAVTAEEAGPDQAAATACVENDRWQARGVLTGVTPLVTSHSGTCRPTRATRAPPSQAGCGHEPRSKYQTWRCGASTSIAEQLKVRDERMKVAIVGGGIGGMALALSLVDAGIHEVDVSSAPAIRELGVGGSTGQRSVRKLSMKTRGWIR